MQIAKKTLTYSLTHFLVALSVAFVLTRDWRAALAIGLIEPIVQTIAYALHERAWRNFELKAALAVGTRPRRRRWALEA